MGGPKCIGTTYILVENILGPQAVSFVERLSLFWSVHHQRFHCIEEFMVSPEACYEEFSLCACVCMGLSLSVYCTNPVFTASDSFFFTPISLALHRSLSQTHSSKATFR